MLSEKQLIVVPVYGKVGLELPHIKSVSHLTRQQKLYILTLTKVKWSVPQWQAVQAAFFGLWGNLAP